MAQTRNTYMISRAMKQFLLSSLLTLIIQQLSITVDSVFVSHYVGPGAMAAITLYMPLSMVVLSLETLLGYGGIIVAVRAMGQQDHAKSNAVLSTALLSLVATGAVLGAATLASRSWLLGLFCTTPELMPHFDSYATISLALMLLPMADAFLGQAVSVDGAPQVATRSALVVLVADVVLDWLFIVALGMGVAGSAWATMIAYALGIGVVAQHLLTHKKSIRFGYYKNMVGRYLKQNVAKGSTLLAANLLLTLLLLINNTYVQRVLGADGMVMLSLCMNIQGIVLLISNGFLDTLIGIGGYLYGEGDYRGLRMLFRLCLSRMLIALTACVLAVELLPQLVTAVFAVDPALLEPSWRALRLYMPYVPLYASLVMVGSFYQVSGHSELVIASIMPLTVLQLPMFWAVSAAMGPDWLWLAFPITACLTFAVMAATSELRRRSEGRASHRLTLIPKVSADELLQASVPASRQGVEQALPIIMQALVKGGVATQQQHAVMHALEELMLNICEHGGRMQGHYFDVRIARNATGLRASVKDDGRPFDPNALPESQRNIGLKLTFAYVKNIDYKYMYGQNVTNIEFNL